MAGLNHLVVRMLALTVLVSLAAVIATIALSSLFLTRFWAMSGVSQPPPAVFRAARACEADPGPAESIDRPPRRFDFYNPETLEPVSADPAPLSPGLRARLLGGARRAVEIGLPLGEGTQAAAVLQPGRRCGLLVITITEAPLSRPNILRFVLAIVGGATAVSLAIAYLFAAAPLLRRVRASSLSARQVGTADFRTSDAAGWDDLGDVNAALALADRRIKDNEALLRRRADTIEALLTSIAHDLKTPLAALHLNLQRAARTEDREELQATLKRALADVHYAAALFDNLEMAAQLDTDLIGAARELVDLRGLVEQTLVRFSILGAHRGVEVDGAWPDGPVLATIEPTLCTRILSNLIHNAIRHGEEGGHVAVTLAASGGRFTITVADDGPGLPDAVLQRLAAPSAPGLIARSADRAGLGLGIVQALARTLDFELSFERPPEGGARITISGRAWSAPAG